jgi:hypothetical protein
MKRKLAAIALGITCLIASILVPASPARANGSLPAGCWNLWINDKQTFLWWTEDTVHFEVDRVCVVWYFAWVIIPPYPYSWANETNNPVFKLWCGWDSYFADWLYGDVNIAWGSSENANFLDTPLWDKGCSPFLMSIDHAGIWVYAGGESLPYVINTSNNWSGPG